MICIRAAELSTIFFIYLWVVLYVLGTRYFYIVIKYQLQSSQILERNSNSSEERFIARFWAVSLTNM